MLGKECCRTERASDYRWTAADLLSLYMWSEEKAA
jgi:hypothetical protein